MKRDMRWLLLVLPALLGCAGAPAAMSPTTSGQESLWSALQALCGKAFEGRLAEGTEPSDAEIGKQRLVMHVRSCSDDELRVPFHVGENRSRTWVITPSGEALQKGYRLKHDHRHEDGSEDAVTQYGGDTREVKNPLSLDFHADALTAQMLPASATNIWTLSIEPGKTFSYALRREASGRRFRVEFDLTRPVPAPPDPW